MVTLGIRIMANLPDRKDDQRRVDHGGQSGHFYLAESGHFYLAESGHFYLAVTCILRIIHIMLNSRLNSGNRPMPVVGSLAYLKSAAIR
jgi:hypothetical protein